MSKAIKDLLNDEKKFSQITKTAFDSVDIDKSGQIDSQELEKVMVQIAVDMGADPPTSEEILEVLNHLDSDHSGKIECNEFEIFIREVLECMIESADY